MMWLFVRFWNNHFANILMLGFQNNCVTALTIHFTDEENEEQSKKVSSQVPELDRAATTIKACPLFFTLCRKLSDGKAIY